MSDATSLPSVSSSGGPRASLAQVFLQFLIIGLTSFGGPVPYLRSRLVAKLGWMDDREFVELLSISQSLPGLNTTNLAILLGDRLRGPWGAAAALFAICLPGGLLMFWAGIFYRLHGTHPWFNAALKGIAAAAIGLILVTVVQLAKRSLGGRADFVFIALTVLAIHRFHFTVLEALFGIGALAIFWHRPRRAAPAPRQEADAP